MCNRIETAIAVRWGIITITKKCRAVAVSERGKLANACMQWPFSLLASGCHARYNSMKRTFRRGE